VHVVFIKAAMLGNFGAAGEDYAGVGFQNNVRRPWIGQRAVELIFKRLQGKNFLDSQRLLVCRCAEVGNHAGSERRVSKPDQRAIVGNIKSFSRANSCLRLSTADAYALLHVDGRLAMFGGNDDERIVKQALLLEFTDH
jgi:hypothetical protein